MSSTPCIQVALACDQKYFDGLLVTSGSMAMNVDRTQRIVFHVIDDGINEDSYTMLVERVVKINPAVSFVRHLIDVETFKNFTAWRGSSATYWRLLLPTLLPDEEFVIYCDVDFLWVGDVYAFWSLRNPNCELVAVRDGMMDKTSREWFLSRHHAIDPDNYFCAGLLLMNLKKMRENGTIAKCLSEIDKLPSPPFCDQDALNLCCEQMTLYAPSRFMTFTSNIRDRKLSDVSALHYVCETPWLERLTTRHIITDANVLWHEYYAIVCGIPRFASFARHYNLIRFFFARLFFVCVAGEKRCNIVCRLCRCLGRNDVASYLRRWAHPLDIDFIMSTHSL